MSLPDLPTALTWLRDVAQDADVPMVLHAHELAPDGAPRMAGGFYAYLTDSPYATRAVERSVRCPAAHPLRRAGEPRCPMCEDTGGWSTATDVYKNPLAAALSTLSRARSRMRPRPDVIVLALIGAGCDTRRAGPPIGLWGADRRWLPAIRALYASFSYTALGPARREEAA